MLDQSFSSSNFNIIFLRENRKGTIKKRHLNQDYFDKHNEFNSVLGDKINLKNLSATNTLSQEQLDYFAKKLDEINKEKEQIRENLFFDYAQTVNDEKIPFCYEIKYDKQNEIYTTTKDGVHFFAIKQLQSNLRKTFKVIQADRNKIIKQTYNLLSDGFPKIIIRTDIAKFYESIPQDKLFEKVDNNTLLSPFSKKLLKRLFFEFERIKDKTIMNAKEGVPRGLGISAYLSELYMREIDNEIKLLPDIIYYARYVDDIVAIFCPKTKSQIRNYQEEIKQIIKRGELEINDNLEGRKDKTQTIKLLENPLSAQEKLIFLGYKFIIKQNHNVIIELSDDKINRYVNRIDLSIICYNKDSKYDEKKARKILIDRFKFLIGNYNLNHNKKNIRAGIFYSNQMLKLNESTFNSLHILNCKMHHKLNNINPPVKIGITKVKLVEFFKARFNFENGFHKKEENFHSFNFNSTEQAYYNKRFNRVTNKFEVIKSIWKDE